MLDDEEVFVTELVLDGEEALDTVLVLLVEEAEGVDEETVVPEELERVCVVVPLVDFDGVDAEVCVVVLAPMPITLAYESMVLMVLPT